jgi:hypothetical protein
MRRLLIALLLFALIAPGCNENKPPPPQAQAESRPQKLVPRDPMEPARPTVAAPAPAKPQEGVTVPPGARWTIYCTTLTGPNHVARAKQLKEALLASSGMTDWYVIHSDIDSTLYYGFYRTFDPRDPNDPKEGMRAQADRQQIDAMVDNSGERPFRNSIFMALDAPDPDAPPEWDLARVRRPEWDPEDPDKPFWSVQIAAYKDSPERKQYAVDVVRAAREQGIEAYYYHGETASIVCIGLWPRKAVRAQESDRGETAASDQPLMVLPFQLPEYMPDDVRDESGKRVKLMAPKTEILDPTLNATLKRYPEHAINGMVNVRTKRDPRTGEVKRVPDPSFLVILPMPKSSLTVDAVPQQLPPHLRVDDRPAAQQDELRAPPPRPADAAPGRGRLRSIGG